MVVVMVVFFIVLVVVFSAGLAGAVRPQHPIAGR